MLRTLIFNTILNTTLYCDVGSRFHTFQHIIREKNVQKYMLKGIDLILVNILCYKIE